MNSSNRRELFGLYGFTHGWSIILNVMTGDEAPLSLADLELTTDVAVHDASGPILRFYEKASGGLEDFIAVNGIRVLSKPEWDAEKARIKG